ncbi:MAG: hypothetical protein R2939_13970 [Kofleriaceae bacterium]
MCVAPGCTFVGYEDAEFAGQAFTYTADTAQLAEFAGSLSGAVVTCE